MKILIFAGGSGRRLWPISLKSSPKQFEKIIGDRSTVQLAVDRVLPMYGAENIFISTNLQYLPILAEQLPMIPKENLIGEPTRRDLAAAVGLAFTHLARSAEPDEPVAILWGDNYIDVVPAFQKVLGSAEKIIQSGDAKIIFIGETPRYPNQNLGWLGLEKQVDDLGGMPVYGYGSLTYRPELDICRKMFAAQTHVWNTGYFVTRIGFVVDSYRQHQAEMWSQLEQIGAKIGEAAYEATLLDIYPTLAEASFDDAILVHVAAEDARIIHAEMGWSDPGTLYALKEAINPSLSENVTKGLVRSLETSDSLLYNYQQDKLLAVVGLESMIVINTEESILVVHKDQIPLVKKLVNNLVGTDLEKYT